MEQSKVASNFEIAPDYKVTDWQILSLDADKPVTQDWDKAISILDRRIRSRFIEPAQFLIDSENEQERGKNGFAILAIDFLLIEAIQGFRGGEEEHKGKSEKLFKEFLTTLPAFIACVPEEKEAEDMAKAVYIQGRCSLHHSGSTDRIIVNRSGKNAFVFHEDGRIEINRSLLHKELTAAFDNYLAELS